MYLLREQASKEDARVEKQERWKKMTKEGSIAMQSLPEIFSSFCWETTEMLFFFSNDDNTGA